jgi:hypothetical protein
MAGNSKYSRFTAEACFLFSAEMKSPNFFIVGAPKCGTTSLAQWLASHPAIFMSPLKEPHYYSADLANRSINSSNKYQALFRKAGPQHIAVGEASTWYLFSKTAIPQIEREHPKALYIVMTRNPVEMAHSLYHHNVRVLHEDQSSFEQAWRLQGTRAAGKNLPGACSEPAFLQYYEACRLGSMLQRLLNLVPAVRIAHVALEDMQSDPRTVYSRILNFLNVPCDNRSSFPIVNPARSQRSRMLQQLIRMGARGKMRLGLTRGFGLARFNERPFAKEPLAPRFASELEATFAEESIILSQLIQKFEEQQWEG